MQPPDELMVEGFLPSMRLLVTKELSSQGLSQSRISQMLGVTQASVSLYLSSSPDKAFVRLSGFGITRSEADRYAMELASAVSRGHVEGISILNSIWKSLLGSGSVCPAHRAISPSLTDCDFCIREYGGAEGPLARTVSEVSDAVRLLESSPVFVAVMPEVSVNLACAAAGASTPADVVAVPGRIVKVKNRARAMLPPEPGASMHMARVLLAIREVRPEIRACINVRYDAKVKRILKGLALRTLVLSSHTASQTDDPTAAALRTAFGRKRGPFDAIVDLGGSGIEPNLYLLSTGATGAVEVALEVARKYSAR